jgi:hypothetical protein
MVSSSCEVPSFKNNTAAGGIFCMSESGVIDQTKDTCYALQHVASIAGRLLTTKEDRLSGPLVVSLRVTGPACHQRPESGWRTRSTGGSGGIEAGGGPDGARW